NDVLTFLKKQRIKFEVLKSPSFFNRFDRKLIHLNIAIELNDKKEISLKDFLNKNKEKKNLLFLMIDSIEDPQNFGAILRTAEGFGVDGVIYKKNNQVQPNELVAKTSMGAVNTLNLFKVTNLVNEINLLKEHGFWIYSSCLNDKSQDYSKVKYDNKSVIVVGNENSGISPIVIKNSDFLIKIRMFGNVQSFNVSVSTGILLSEVRKQIN
ncbi:MAG: 23S rRNA (guanosine(2251)-2'-O)-methyltransferase RlmB, partial [Mycoplasmoidaceae bacterium]|nr:23S rRNA (guanosine(2251)-2'-O)-methyltransferase RlmB [Mycoplasmoidaceae bacterium]